MERVGRGGDITYHGPGQLVGYPILTVPGKGATAGNMADTVAYVRSVEQMVIDVLVASELLQQANRAEAKLPLAASFIHRRMLVVEMNAGQMLQDVQRIAGRQIPVEFLGRMGGQIPLPGEVELAARRLYERLLAEEPVFGE